MAERSAAIDLGTEMTSTNQQATLLDADRLGRWLVSAGLAVTPRITVERFSGGQSNPTFLLRIEPVLPDQPDRLVLRRKPPPPILPSAHQVEREYRVISALHRTGLPVPRPRILCEDAELIGSAFYVMDFVPGQIYGDPAIPGQSASARRVIYDQLAENASLLHSIDPVAVGLGQFGRPGNYVARQFRRWRKQYEAAEDAIPAMDRLCVHLADRLPESSARAVIHGDFRLGNQIYDSHTHGISAILDWELATLGDPWSDLAYCCMPWHMSHDSPALPGLLGLDIGGLGIPSEAEFLARYCERGGLSVPVQWPIYLAFNFFRLAAICHGIKGRAMVGNASGADAIAHGERVPMLAEIGLGMLRVIPA